jgi:hypothetical protein
MKCPRENAKLHACGKEKDTDTDGSREARFSSSSEAALFLRSEVRQIRAEQRR